MRVSVTYHDLRDTQFMVHALHDYMHMLLGSICSPTIWSVSFFLHLNRTIYYVVLFKCKRKIIRITCATRYNDPYTILCTWKDHKYDLKYENKLNKKEQYVSYKEMFVSRQTETIEHLARQQKNSDVRETPRIVTALSYCGV